MLLKIKWTQRMKNDEKMVIQECNRSHKRMIECMQWIKDDERTMIQFLLLRCSFLTLKTNKQRRGLRQRIFNWKSDFTMDMDGFYIKQCSNG
ncbi:hypothetical protein CEXT_567151 [Caerostris extrusa]|uniref:Uncharacterized protein n=1 Tax=Caerostris extrusa TaxID=172846 RepID=A0AAV4QDX1_CAEEX|nr:hypothetical protein CEXT_567151 [Caerostris extrusa]